MTVAKSFKNKKKVITFEIDDDQFTTRAGIPMYAMMELSGIGDKIATAATAGEKLEHLMLSFKYILDKPSYELMEKRLYDMNNPIDSETFTEVMEWLVGEALGKGSTPK